MVKDETSNPINDGIKGVNNFPIINCLSEIGAISNCSIVFRSFSPAKLSAAKVTGIIAGTRIIVLADILTIHENKGELRGLKLAYIGDGNNVANSLLLACSQTGIDFQIASPAGYKLGKEILKTAREIADQTGSKITLTDNPRQAVEDADIVYTDVWTSMGQETQAKKRRTAFSGFQVDADLLSRAKKEVIFMHPLPAHHGEEIAAGLLDHPASVVFDQAENRLHMQKALLAALFHDRREKQ